MGRPTIMIQKKKIFDSKGWNRYYRQIIIDLNRIPIQTEAQLCKFIYNNFGEGHYMVFAWKKGHRGFWVFWKGDIEKDGFMFQKKDNWRTEDVKSLQEEYEEAETPEERGDLHMMLKEEVEENKKRRYGFGTDLKSSGKRGTFVFWEDG